MGVNTGTAYIVLLALVGLVRLVELRISRRHQRWLAVRNIAKQPERHFRWMVMLHAGVLVGAGTEVFALRRPFIPALAAVMAVVFLLANALRWWVIRSMGQHWNVQVMASTRLGVVTRGPFRWIRHPNYVAVFAEMISLPLIHSAWLTATLGGTANAWVLHRRLAVEERLLLGDPAYRESMGAKPRFLPRLF